jgi:hypothetical protein
VRFCRWIREQDIGDDASDSKEEKEEKRAEGVSETHFPNFLVGVFLIQTRAVPDHPDRTDIADPDTRFGEIPTVPE